MSAVGVEQRAARTKSDLPAGPGRALPPRAPELSGREFLDAIIDGRLPPPPIARLIGAELVSVGEGEALFRCAPDESTYNPIGIVHGGLPLHAARHRPPDAPSRPCCPPAPATARSRSRSAS